MITKLEFPTQFPTPISEELHIVLEDCGYELTYAGPLCLEYESPNKRLSFSEVNGFCYEIMFGKSWQSQFRIQSSQPISEFQYMELLQIMAAIDYTALKAYRTMKLEIKDLLIPPSCSGQYVTPCTSTGSTLATRSSSEKKNISEMDAEELEAHYAQLHAGQVGDVHERHTLLLWCKKMYHQLTGSDLYNVVFNRKTLA